MELELGLYDEAGEKFARASDCGDVNILPIAVYGYGLSLLSMAQRDNQDGKAGSAFLLLHKGVQECLKLGERTNVCVQKLLGDMYSLAATLPPDVFGDGNDSDAVASEFQLKSQLDFVSKGKAAYDRAQIFVAQSSEDNALRASLVSDGGSNLVLQAQLLSSWESNGLYRQASSESSILYENAANEYRRALNLSPTYAPAWCGLGCAVVRTDPLLAQHSFSRSQELDGLAPDPYANLSFLYTSHRRYKNSAQVSDALTEVADTPMMWINRAVILEHTAASNPGEPQSQHCIMQAADAYRAALQVVKHPIAMIGLALTCRMTVDEPNAAVMDAVVMESSSYMTEYIGMVGRYDLPAVLMDGVLEMEAGIMNRACQGVEQIENGRQQVVVGLDQIEPMHAVDDQGNSLCLEIFRKVAAANDIDIEHRPDIKEDTEWSLGRQVVHNPNRGDLWLQLAKQLVQETPPGGSIEPAALAAHRASSILMRQLTKTLAFQATKESRFINAHDVADALALQYWLAEAAQPNETEEGEHEQEIKPSALSTVDLQRSLLINPGNALARHALTLLV